MFDIHIPHRQKITAFGLILVAFWLAGCSQQTTAEVTQGALVQDIEVTGEIGSAQQISLMPPVMKKVWQYQVKYLAPEGEEVKAGQLVASLDTTEIAQRLQQKTANLNATVQDIKTSKMRNEHEIQNLKLQLAQAKMVLDKAELKCRLSDDNVAQIDQQKNKLDVEIARNRVNLMQKQLRLERQSIRQREAMLEGDKKKFSSEVKSLQTGMTAMNIKSPTDGMLIYGVDYQGNKIQQGQSIFVGDAVVSIADLQQIQVKMSIPEIEAERIVKGQQVSICLDANPERQFKGKITQLSAIFRKKSNELPLVVFDALASVEHPDPELVRPGMTAKINIELPKAPQSLLLPESAVHYDGGQAFVYRSDWFCPKKQSVKVGGVGSGMVAILSGVQLGDKVVL